MSQLNEQYPATFSVDYPEKPLDKLTTFFRIFAVIPIAIILALVSGGDNRWMGAGGLVVAATALMIVFQQKYPRWWFDWNCQLLAFGSRVASYFGLLRDKYPSTDEEQAVHLKLTYPDVKNQLNRWLPLINWFLAIPHFIVLILLGIAAFLCVIAAWFAILFTGAYPKALFDFVTGVYRWSVRVTAYALLMATDKYPPFSLN